MTDQNISGDLYQLRQDKVTVTLNDLLSKARALENSERQAKALKKS